MNIIFDYDGTLHDTLYIYKEALQEAYNYLVKENLAKPKKINSNYAKQFLGVSSELAWDTICPNLNPNIKSKIIQIVGAKMDFLIREGKSSLYENVNTTLKYLKENGHNLFILSNCTINYIKSHNNNFNLDNYILGFYPAEKYEYIEKKEIFKIIKGDILLNYMANSKKDNLLNIISKNRKNFKYNLYNYFKTIKLNNENYKYFFKNLKDLQGFYEFSKDELLNKKNTKDIFNYFYLIYDAFENKDNFLILGDRHHDISTGYENNFTSVASLYGFGNNEEFKNANYTIEDIKNLPSIVNKLEN